MAVASNTLLSPAQRHDLENLPDKLDDRELIRCFTLSDEDILLVKRHRGDKNRVLFALQLGVLRFMGRNLRQNEAVPEQIMSYICKQLKVLPKTILPAVYDRSNTRWEHLGEIQKAFGFQSFTGSHYEELSNWLFQLALSTDREMVLFQELVSEMRRRKLILPAFSTLEQLVRDVLQQAREEVYSHLAESIDEVQKEKLELLLRSEGEFMTQLVWLRQPVGRSGPTNFLKLVERLKFIANIGINTEVHRHIHQNRFLQLAREGMKYKPQHLQRFTPLKRYALLVAFLLECQENLTDQALEMFERMVGTLFNRSEHKQMDQFQRSAKAINEKIWLYATIGKELIAARERQQDAYQVIESIIPWERFIDSVDKAEKLCQSEKFDFFIYLKDRYPQVRQYSPELLKMFVFRGIKANESLIKAIELLKELNADGKRKIPETAPLDFIKPRWEKYVVEPMGINRAYYEMCVLAELKNGLRSGDIAVAGSKQFKDFEEYLFPRSKWPTMLNNPSLPLAISTDFNQYMNERRTQLQEQLKTVNGLLKTKKLANVRLENDALIISPEPKGVPDEMITITQRVYGILPRIKLTDLLAEVDSWVGFTDYFTHLHDGHAQKDKKALFTAILADGTNMGISKMAECCPGITREKLVWVYDWYIRDDTYTKALAEIVNFHHQLPFSAQWGTGKTSSSDGQRFKLGKKQGGFSDINPKYGSEPGITFYTHISDQYSPFYIKVIHCNIRDATHVLDGLLYHETDLKIEEHYTDTAGFTDHVFALCHLLGFRFAPRIRDLGDKVMYCFDSANEYPLLEPILSSTPLQTKLLEKNWDDILRLAYSIRMGTVTASLIIRKLASYPRQNQLALALRELGRLERTFFMLDWLQSPELRKRVQIGLNKGEARNALARAVFLYRHGELADRSYEDLRYRASGLNLIVAAIILWNTVYINEAVKTIRQSGFDIAEEFIKHISPLGWEHIGLTGDYIWNLQQRTDLQNLRSLRVKSKV